MVLLLCGSPAETSGGWRPCLTELAKQNDAPEMIGIVGCEALQLFAHRHDADGIARSRGATHRFLQSSVIRGHGSNLLKAAEEALP